MSNCKPINGETQREKEHRHTHKTTIYYHATAVCRGMLAYSAKYTVSVCMQYSVDLLYLFKRADQTESSIVSHNAMCTA